MREPVEIMALDLEVPVQVTRLHGIFSKAGAKLYAVGGFVRDAVRSKLKGTPFVPKDCDLVTNLLPDQVIALLKGFSVKEVGKAFGVILVNLDGEDFEIATFREDAKTGDGRRPDFVTFSTIDKDAERRDLTINALYYDLDRKVVLDFFGGIQHTFSGKVVFVGDAVNRINEDKLRALRFARFHCRMDAGIYADADTTEVIRKVSLRPEISNERIRDEFLKGLSSAKSKDDYLFLLDDLNLLEQVFHGLIVAHSFAKMEGETYENIIAEIVRYNSTKKVHEVLLELKYTAQEAKNIAFLVNMTRWSSEEEFVEFKRSQAATTLKLEDLNFKLQISPILVFDMAYAPYPTVKGEEVMAETGLSGKALGDEIRRREVKNFRKNRVLYA